MQLVLGSFGQRGAGKRPANDSRGKRRGRESAAASASPTEERSFSEPPPKACDTPEIAILDGDGRIVAVNPAWRNAFAASGGLAPRDAGVGALYVDVAGRSLADADRLTLEFGLQHLLLGGIDNVQQTCAVQMPGGRRLRHMQVTPLSVGTDVRFVAIHGDQTQPARTQEALQATSGELLQARDDERERIAIELHDSTSQHLAAISLGLMQLRRASPPDGPSDAIIDEIRKSLNEAVKETRVLSYLMKPRGLGQDGLSATVQQFLEGFARRTGLEVALKVDGAVDGVPPPLQHAALRIVQEALLNANRHAQARSVSVALSVENGLFTVSVTDDGRGFRWTDQGEANLGVGIPGMQARAQQFSGDLAISSDETGTRVVALLPIT